MTEAQTEANRWTKDPNAWPDEDGDYRLRRDDGGWRWWIDHSTFGDDTEMVAEATWAVLNGGVVLPPLPDWMGYEPCATGAALVEHDPNGDDWERSLVGISWRRDHADGALHEYRYTLRPVSPPAAPTVERVHWWEAKGRRLPSGAKVYSVTDDANGVRVWGDPWPAPIDADGMVSVLADDIEGERS